jgi:hypothetical protein
MNGYLANNQPRYPDDEIDREAVFLGRAEHPSIVRGGHFVGTI